MVVGKPYYQTPAFSATVTHLVINPYWNVPRGIAEKEILPRFDQNPEEMARSGFRVLRGWGADTQEIASPDVPRSKGTFASGNLRLRQDPGPRNALGRIKFMFPNRFHVYLHDTPERGLFARHQRAFSHGCIRVAHALELATHLLRGTRWTHDRIQSAIDRMVEKTVPLPEPIPIHILYKTAWVGPDGRIHFRKDIYLRDEKLWQALRKPLLSP